MNLGAPATRQARTQPPALQHVDGEANAGDGDSQTDGNLRTDDDVRDGSVEDDTAIIDEDGGVDIHAPAVLYKEGRDNFGVGTGRLHIGNLVVGFENPNVDWSA